jgi:hypothetical protein
MSINDIIGRRGRESLGETSRKCGALTRDTGFCQRAPIPGGFRCSLHGGNNPDVRRAARQRLASMVEPALARLEAFFQDRPPCPHCGRTDADRDPVVLGAIKILLDRVGFSPTNATAAVEQPTDIDSLSPEETRARLLELRARLDQMLGDQPLVLPAVIDTESLNEEEQDGRKTLSPAVSPGPDSDADADDEKGNGGAKV